MIFKPDNPIDFIANYLPTKYPNDIKKVLNLNEVSTSNTFDLKTPTNVSDDDENSPLFITGSPKAVGKRGRKGAFSAESMDPNEYQENLKNLIFYDKTPSVYATLLQVVSTSHLLRALDLEQKDLLVKAFSGPYSIENETDIIVQGDIGDTFYLIEEGDVDVYVNDNKVHSYHSGDSFGELALLYNSKRAATCRSSSKCKLWSVDRTSFKCIVVAAIMNKRELFRGFLSTVPILGSLTDIEVLTLADAMTVENYNDQSIVCKQGEPGNYFYIIWEGQATCTIENRVGDNTLVATLESGNYFGEVALLTNVPRQATGKRNFLLFPFDYTELILFFSYCKRRIEGVVCRQGNI